MKELILFDTDFIPLKESLLKECRKNLNMDLMSSLKPFFIEILLMDLLDDI
jgi:hypothetical protein